MTIKENYLEWALKHLLRFYDSDFYPRIPEFRAISHNWQHVKDYILSLDLEVYRPKSPILHLAPKPDGNFRIVHQLDPIDSLVYTALIREICEIIESFRIPESEKKVFSYRIKPDLEGSFFPKSNTGWQDFILRTEKLAKKYKEGFVINADITDFYNQIYLHRIQNLIVEAGKGTLNEQADAVHNFLLGLNKQTSRGIPVGPAPSIILAELIMADIDNKIRTYTPNFARYVDDIRIFFKTREKAIYVLHQLTGYLYSSHRLVFSGAKTNIHQTKTFINKHLRDEEKLEREATMVKAEKFALEKLEESYHEDPGYSYDSDYNYVEEYEEILDEIIKDKKFKILSTTYYELLCKSLQSPIDYALLRHLLRKAKKYRIRNLVPKLLEEFEKILPVIREAVIYLKAVIDEETVSNNWTKFENIFKAHYMLLPFVNLWISYLLQNKNFDVVKPPKDYDILHTTRSQAFIALRSRDSTWVRGFRDTVDVLGPTDKRGVLFCSSILPDDEMKAWLDAVSKSGDIIDQSISSLLNSEKKSSKG